MNFINSKEFKRFQGSDLSKVYGEVNYELTRVNEFFVKDRKYYNLYIVFGEDAKNVNAVLEAVELPKEVDLERMPNKDQYVMILRDYRKYNLETLTGKILMYDLNFDNFFGGEIEAGDYRIKKWQISDYSPSIRKKYAGVFEKNLAYFNASARNRNARKHICDKNNDDNIGFFECYGCMKDSCSGDSMCDTMCDIFNIFGGLCHGSIAAACVIISASDEFCGCPS